MNSPTSGNITQLLIDWSNGDESAFNQLWTFVYDELRRIAGKKIRQHGSNILWQPTLLVHEAYLNLVDAKQVKWQNRAHFYKFASTLIRNILIDKIREENAQKRGGKVSLVSISEVAGNFGTPNLDLLALNEALKKLATLDQRQAEITEMKFFGGMQNNEIAAVLKIGVATVEREWRAAKAWLYSQLA